MTKILLNPDQFLTHDILNLSGISHGFFTRQGGVSQGIYHGLNCGAGSDDHPEYIRENRNRVARSLGKDDDQLLSLYQIHSADVYIIDQKPDLDIWHSMARPKADGFVTKRDDIALGILTADCGPVLFADQHAGVIGAAHAGWKGAFSGVLSNTVTAMEKLGAKRSNIHAVLGPCIHQVSYEVGPEFVARFESEDPDSLSFFIPSQRAEHSLFDLPGFVMAQLEKLGLGAIANLALDTRADETRFFSYRRTTLAKEPDYGRQISAIALSS